MIREDIACARKTAKQMGKTDGLKFTTELLNTLKDAEIDLKKELDKLTDAQLDGETELFFTLFEDIKKSAPLFEKQLQKERIRWRRSMAESMRVT